MREPTLVSFRLRYLGANSIKLTSDGHIEVLSAANPLDMTAPVAHQGMGKNSLEIPIRFSLNGTVVTFDFPDGYDPTLPIVIDPVLNYGTYLGYSGDETSAGIAIRPWCPQLWCGESHVLPIADAGAVYMAGTSNSGGNGGNDAFVAKLRTEGKEVLTLRAALDAFNAQEFPYIRYVGTPGDDTARGIALDEQGYAYLVGRTEQNHYDAFIAKVDPSDGHLIFLTLFGGEQYDSAQSVAYDPSNHSLVVVGTTSSTDYPTVNPLPGHEQRGGDPAIETYDAFVARVNTDGSLVFSTYLGGDGGQFSRDEIARDVAVVNDGSFLVVGSVDSTNFLPVDKATFQPGYAGGTDAFIAKFSPSGQDVDWWSYLGDPGGDHGYAVAVDEIGQAYVGGATSSRGLGSPQDVVQADHAGGTYDGYFAGFSPEGSFSFFSYLGGSGEQDNVDAIALDPTGHISLTGYTSSDFTGAAEFPTTLMLFSPTLVEVARCSMHTSRRSTPTRRTWSTPPTMAGRAMTLRQTLCSGEVAPSSTATHHPITYL